MSNQKLMILIWLNQTKLKNGLASQYLRTSKDGQKVAFATKHFVDLTQWNVKQESLSGLPPCHHSFS